MPPSLWELLGEVVLQKVHKRIAGDEFWEEKASPDLNPSNAFGMKYNRNDELASVTFDHAKHENTQTCSNKLKIF